MHKDTTQKRPFLCIGCHNCLSHFSSCFLCRNPSSILRTLNTSYVLRGFPKCILGCLICSPSLSLSAIHTPSQANNKQQQLTAKKKKNNDLFFVLLLSQLFLYKYAYNPTLFSHHPSCTLPEHILIAEFSPFPPGYLERFCLHLDLKRLSLVFLSDSLVPHSLTQCTPPPSPSHNSFIISSFCISSLTIAIYALLADAHRSLPHPFIQCCSLSFSFHSYHVILP